MQDKIKDWLIKSGYPLELYTYEYFAKRKYLCEKSSFYNDIELGIKREIDVIAYLHGPFYETYSYSLQLLIECKKSEKPLLLLSEGRNEERYKQLLGSDVVNEESYAAFLAYSYLENLEINQKVEHIGQFAELAPVGYSLVPAFGTSDENIYKGIMGLAKADDYHRSIYNEFFIRNRDDKSLHCIDINPFQLQIPLLVVDAPLFTVNIDNSGELKIESINWGSLTVNLPWNLDTKVSERRCNIQIVRKENLDEVVQNIEKFFLAISKEHIVKPAVVNSIKKLSSRNVINYFQRFFRH